MHPRHGIDFGTTLVARRTFLRAHGGARRRAPRPCPRRQCRPCCSRAQGSARRTAQRARTACCGAARHGTATAARTAEAHPPRDSGRGRTHCVKKRNVPPVRACGIEAAARRRIRQRRDAVGARIPGAADRQVGTGRAGRLRRAEVPHLYDAILAAAARQLPIDVRKRGDARDARAAACAWHAVRFVDVHGRGALAQVPQIDGAVACAAREQAAVVGVPRQCACAPVVCVVVRDTQLVLYVPRRHRVVAAADRQDVVVAAPFRGKDGAVHERLRGVLDKA